MVTSDILSNKRIFSVSASQPERIEWSEHCVVFLSESFAKHWTLFESCSRYWTNQIFWTLPPPSPLSPPLSNWRYQHSNLLFLVPAQNPTVKNFLCHINSQNDFSLDFLTNIFCPTNVLKFTACVGRDQALNWAVTFPKFFHKSQFCGQESWRWWQSPV